MSFVEMKKIVVEQEAAKGRSFEMPSPVKGRSSGSPRGSPRRDGSPTSRMMYNEAVSQRQQAERLPRASSRGQRPPVPAATTTTGATRQGGAVLFHLEIDLGKGRPAGRLVVREGDEPAILAKEFAAEHRLPSSTKVSLRLEKLIVDNMKTYSRT